MSITQKLLDDFVQKWSYGKAREFREDVERVILHHERAAANKQIQECIDALEGLKVPE